MKRPSRGALLSEAATLALGAERLAIAALIRLEDAETDDGDFTFIVDTEVEPVDLPALCEGLGIFSENLVRLADAYGHAEVRRRFRYQGS